MPGGDPWHDASGQQKGNEIYLVGRKTEAKSPDSEHLRHDDNISVPQTPHQSQSTSAISLIRISSIQLAAPDQDHWA